MYIPKKKQRIRCNEWTQNIVDRLERGWNKRDQSTAFFAFGLAASHGSTFLDIGCGYGRFYEYLKKMNKEFSYIGYDSSKAMIRKARTIHPEMAKNFCSWEITEPFISDLHKNVEVILCHDVFFHLIPEDQLKVLSNINKCSAHTLVINIQSSTKPPRIERAKLDGQEFLHIVQNLDTFKKTISETISNISSIEVHDRPLAHNVNVSTLIVGKGGNK